MHFFKKYFVFIYINRMQAVTHSVTLFSLSCSISFYFSFVLIISSGLMWEWYENEMAWNAGKIANSEHRLTVEGGTFVSIVPHRELCLLWFRIVEKNSLFFSSCFSLWCSYIEFLWVNRGYGGEGERQEGTVSQGFFSCPCIDFFLALFFVCCFILGFFVFFFLFCGWHLHFLEEWKNIFL